MQDLLSGVLSDASALSALELLAFLLGIVYLLLAIRESVWCWICAIGSSCIFGFLFARSLIYMDAALQVFYAAVAVDGWFGNRKYVLYPIGARCYAGSFMWCASHGEIRGP